MVVRVGILGYGHLGRHLASRVQADPGLELAFVWSRSPVEGVLPVLRDLRRLAEHAPDLVVEVAHPDVTREHAAAVLDVCDYLVGSPTALCDGGLRRRLCGGEGRRGVYVAVGAFWGAEDVRKMDEARQLRSLHVTMRMHPSSLKLEERLRKLNDSVRGEPTKLYLGPVGGVCPLAPRNVNTMAVAALAAPRLGFEGVTGCLISDPSLEGCHVVEIEALGFEDEGGACFSARTERRNPAGAGHVTGSATFDAFFGSLKRAGGKGPGIHLC